MPIPDELRALTTINPVGVPCPTCGVPRSHNCQGIQYGTCHRARLDLACERWALALEAAIESARNP